MIARALILFFAASSAAHAGVVTLENTIPSGNLFLQPPLLTGAAPVFGLGGGVVAANGFTAHVSATLYQVSVAVEYEDFPSLVTGRSPMLLTFFTDRGNAPGAPLESWTVPLNPSDTSLTIVTVDSIARPLLLAGEQYWLSEVPVDPVHTGIGWGLASSGYPGIQLPIAESVTGANSGWSMTRPNLANEFSVSGTTVPEPATFGTSALVLLCCLAVLRHICIQQDWLGPRRARQMQALLSFFDKNHNGRIDPEERPALMKFLETQGQRPQPAK